MSSNAEHLIRQAENHERRAIQKLAFANRRDDDTIADELRRDCRATRQAADHFTIAMGLRAMASRIDQALVKEFKRHTSGADHFGHRVEDQHDR